MMSLLLDLGPWLLGGGLTVVLILAIVWLIGGPALLLNRWVLLAIGIVVLVTCGGTWLAAHDHRVREEGAAAERDIWQQVNAAAEKRRKYENEKYKASRDVTEQQLKADVAKSDKRVRDLNKRLKERGNVTPKADAACPVPIGFVRDYNDAVPSTTGRAEVQPAATGSADQRSTVVLSAIRDSTVTNFGACSQLLERVQLANEKRYKDCTEYDRIYNTDSGCAR